MGSTFIFKERVWTERILGWKMCPHDMVYGLLQVGSLMFFAIFLKLILAYASTLSIYLTEIELYWLPI